MEAGEGDAGKGFPAGEAITFSLMATTQRISANAIAALKDALTAAFWFKRDLYNYAKAAVAGEPTFLSGIEWTSPDQYKRDSVNLFVDRLVRWQDDHQDLLIALLVDVAAMDDFPYLQRADDPAPKIAAAREAVARLRAVVQPYERAMMEQQANRERIDAARTAAVERRATSERLAALKARYREIVTMPAQSRGFALEKLLHDALEAFDLDPKASFRVAGEQIDGGLTFGGEYFLVEAKWQQDPTARDDLDVFSAKVRRRGEKYPRAVHRHQRLRAHRGRDSLRQPLADHAHGRRRPLRRARRPHRPARSAQPQATRDLDDRPCPAHRRRDPLRTLSARHGERACRVSGFAYDAGGQRLSTEEDLSASAGGGVERADAARR